jgi:hypothetical protein
VAGLRLQAVGDEIGHAIDKLTNVDVTDRDFALWLDEIAELPELDAYRTGRKGQPLGPGRKYLGAERKREELTRLWTKDAKVAPWAGTAFGILQCSNTYRTWTQNVQAFYTEAATRSAHRQPEGK